MRTVPLFATHLLAACLLAACLFVIGLLPTGLSAAEPNRGKFDFGSGETMPGYTPVTPHDTFTPVTGWGFEPYANIEEVDRKTPDALRSDFCTSNKPFSFSVELPEGNHLVTVTLGDTAGDSNTTVKAETRRLMLEAVTTADGAFRARTFAVNIRRPQIAGSGGKEVRLKTRERSEGSLTWDKKLTLEFNGPRPSVCAVEIAPAEDLPTVFILGDSTVCDQPREPYASWGQMLTRFFRPTVALANYAESGESIHSSRSAGRIDKMLSQLRSGDHVLIQFGHNDMKSVSSDVFQENLRQLVEDIRAKGGQVVLITPVQRRRFEGNRNINSHLDFPDKVRALAKEENVPLVDLHASSNILYEALGPEGSAALFKEGDGSHHNAYGAYEIARCIAQGLKETNHALAKHLTSDAVPFDPTKPDPPEQFDLPVSPGDAGRKPDGN